MDKQKLLLMLRAEEGVRLHPYTDTVGKLTIGVGRNLTDRGINDEECNRMLERDIDEHWEQLVNAIPWVAELDEVRQRVLADMAFNMGVGDQRHGLLSFSTTLNNIRHGNYQAAAAGMLTSLWASQVGNRARRLAHMMETGEDWPLT